MVIYLVYDIQKVVKINIYLLINNEELYQKVVVYLIKLFYLFPNVILNLVY